MPRQIFGEGGIEHDLPHRFLAPAILGGHCEHRQRGRSALRDALQSLHRQRRRRHGQRGGIDILGFRRGRRSLDARIERLQLADQRGPQPQHREQIGAGQHDTLDARSRAGGGRHLAGDFGRDRVDGRDRKQRDLEVQRARAAGRSPLRRGWIDRVDVIVRIDIAGSRGLGLAAFSRSDILEFGEGGLRRVGTRLPARPGEARELHLPIPVSAFHTQPASVA